MRAHGEKLSRKQEQTIAALLTCSSITEASQQCGIAEATIHRWLKDADFQTAYREARRAVVQQAIAQVQQATGAAVETLRTVMQPGILTNTSVEVPMCPESAWPSTAWQAAAILAQFSALSAISTASDAAL